MDNSQQQQNPFNQQPNYNAQMQNPSEQRFDWLVTLLLCIFLGTLGIHRFYTKNVGIGVGQLLTAAGCGVWWLVDVILIVTDNYHDGNGNVLVRKN